MLGETWCSAKGFGQCLAFVVLVAFGLPVVAEGATSSPDGRRYELVSPPNKEGGDVMSDAGRIHIATSGNAVAFPSLRGFSGTLGAGVGTEYVSVRDGKPGTNGWATHSLEPRRDALSTFATLFGKDLRYEDTFSDDLSRAALQSFTPLTDSPNVAQVSNLYLRADALSAGEGTYQLLTDCIACSAPLDASPNGFFMPRVADATPDLGHIIFEALPDLTPDSAGLDPFSEKLYEWDHGTLRLAGVLPDGTPAPSSVAGGGATQLLYTPHTISKDGSRIIFTVPDSPGDVVGAIYMRVDHSSTIQINASERTDCADGDPCTGAPAPDSPQPARFQTATPDGSRVFFTTDERLTDASQGGLYMYDATLPASDPHNLTLIAPSTQGVVGVSDDGSYVYLIGGELLPGQPGLPLDTPKGLYLWHDGSLTFIGSLPFDVTDSITLGYSIWALRPLSSRVAPDGKSLIFTTDGGSGLTGFDHGSNCPFNFTGGCDEVYLYRADTNTVKCLSCNPTGAPGIANSTFSIKVGTGGFASSPHINHAISDNGDRVFFETRNRLVPEDRDGTKSDVYEYDVPTDTFHLISSGTSTDDSHFLDATGSGNDVLFTTNQQLVGWDTDDNYDVYDARVGGGFPEPPAAKAECSGDACQGAVGAVPGSSDASSSGAVPHSNNVVSHGGATKRRHCARGKVRRRVHGHVRCVKRHRHKAKRSVRGTTAR